MIRAAGIIIVALVLSYLVLDVLRKPLESITPTRATQPSDKITATSEQAGDVPEILAIKATTDFTEQVQLYRSLIQRVGYEKAQEALYQSGLPFDGQTHLLNHTVGQMLNKMYGAKGLSYCKDYFLSSCYHGFVIDAVGADGMQVLSEVMKNCWSRGDHVAIQCSHAIGHGMLAFNGYKNLPEALVACDEMISLSERFPVFNCYDGVFMENIWAVHESGEPSQDRWVKDDDPIYPCNDARIANKYIQACWSNQPMRLYQLYSGDVAQVGAVCDGITDKSHQATCFDGLARQIHPVTKGSVDETFRLCEQMPTDWVHPCIISIARSAFSVGDREEPFAICARIAESGKSGCYSGLVNSIVSMERDDKEARRGLCNKLPDEWRSGCLN